MTSFAKPLKKKITLSSFLIRVCIAAIAIGLLFVLVGGVLGGDIGRFVWAGNLLLYVTKYGYIELFVLPAWLF